MDNKNMNTNIRKLEKDEDKLLKQLNKCNKTKYSKKNKLKEKENKIFEKEQDKQCLKTLTNEETNLLFLLQDQLNVLDGQATDLNIIQERAKN